jgi:hypothetical protein
MMHECGYEKGPLIPAIWTYGKPLWGTASNSNIEILQIYQNKVLRAIVNSPWHISNRVLHTDLKVTNN